MISKEYAEHYIGGDGCDGWHLVKNSEVSIIHELMPPHTQEIRRSHNRAWQFFFILVGIATMKIENETVILGPQQGIEILPNVPHQMCNESNEICEFLVYSQPPSHGDRIELLSHCNTEGIIDTFLI